MKVGSTVAVAALALALVVGGGALGAPAERDDPQLLVGDSVAGDFAALARDTYGALVAASPGIGECVRSPRLEAVYDLDELAVYDQRTHVMSVRVPATASSLAASLIHELAHHLELSCPSHPAMRVRFLAAQGLDPATPWFGGDVWEEIPSERFAESVVHVVLGGRERHLLRMHLTEDAVDVVAGWLASGD